MRSRAATPLAPSPGQGGRRPAPGESVLSRVRALSVALCLASPRRKARGACAVPLPCAAPLVRDLGAASRPSGGTAAPPAAPRLPGTLVPWLGSRDSAGQRGWQWGLAGLGAAFPRDCLEEQPPSAPGEQGLPAPGNLRASDLRRQGSHALWKDKEGWGQADFVGSSCGKREAERAWR